MVYLGTDTDPFAQGVVMVAGHMGLQRLAVFKAQRVQEFRPPECLAQYLGLHRGGVVVHDVVGAQQKRTKKCIRKRQ